MLELFKQQLAQQGEIYLRLKVRAGAAQTACQQVLADQTIKLSVAAPPVKGRANAAIIDFFAKEFAIKKNNVKLIAGAGEPTKLIKLIK